MPHGFCSSGRPCAVSSTCLQDSEGTSDPRLARGALSLPDVKFDCRNLYNVRGVAVLSAGGQHLLESFSSSGTLERNTKDAHYCMWATPGSNIFGMCRMSLSTGRRLESIVQVPKLFAYMVLFFVCASH